MDLKTLREKNKRIQEERAAKLRKEEELKKELELKQKQEKKNQKKGKKPEQRVYMVTENIETVNEQPEVVEQPVEEVIEEAPVVEE